MGHGFTCYAVFGIKREMPTRVLPNGTVLNLFSSILTEGKLTLEASLELMGEPGKFLIGYQLAWLDHHGAPKVERAYDPEVRTRLLHELRDAGMKVNDDEPTLYLHMDSDQFEH